MDRINSNNGNSRPNQNVEANDSGSESSENSDDNLTGAGKAAKHLGKAVSGFLKGIGATVSPSKKKQPTQNKITRNEALTQDGAAFLKKVDKKLDNPLTRVGGQKKIADRPSSRRQAPPSHSLNINQLQKTNISDLKQEQTVTPSDYAVELLQDLVSNDFINFQFSSKDELVQEILNNPEWKGILAIAFEEQHKPGVTQVNSTAHNFDPRAGEKAYTLAVVNELIAKGVFFQI